MILLVEGYTLSAPAYSLLMQRLIFFILLFLFFVQQSSRCFAGPDGDYVIQVALSQLLPVKQDQVEFGITLKLNYPLFIHDVLEDLHHDDFLYHRVILGNALEEDLHTQESELFLQLLESDLMEEESKAIKALKLRLKAVLLSKINQEMKSDLFSDRKIGGLFAIARIETSKKSAWSKTLEKNTLTVLGTKIVKHFLAHPEDFAHRETTGLAEELVKNSEVLYRFLRLNTDDEKSAYLFERRKANPENEAIAALFADFSKQVVLNPSASAFKKENPDAFYRATAAYLSDLVESETFLHEFLSEPSFRSTLATLDWEKVFPEASETMVRTLKGMMSAGFKMQVGMDARDFADLKPSIIYANVLRAYLKHFSPPAGQAKVMMQAMLRDFINELENGTALVPISERGVRMNQLTHEFKTPDELAAELSENFESFLSWLEINTDRLGLKKADFSNEISRFRNFLMLRFPEQRCRIMLLGNLGKFSLKNFSEN